MTFHNKNCTHIFIMTFHNKSGMEVQRSKVNFEVMRLILSRTDYARALTLEGAIAQFLVVA